MTSAPDAPVEWVAITFPGTTLGAGVAAPLAELVDAKTVRLLDAAVVHYVQGLAFQHAAAGVRANVVSPGNTYFPGGVWANIESGNPDLFSTALGLNPTGRMAKPEEVAYAVTMLASPRASFITGTNVVVDGALTRGVQL